MINFKKLVATGMVATMLVGSCLTAFAEDAPTSGSQTGDGASEGHVDKNIVRVVLPTTDATTFKYTMDPERLITATDAAKYDEGTVFPETGDTGVYFLTGDKTYENSSKTVQIVNKGAVAQKVTVTAKLVAGTKDIAILTAAPDSSAQAAGLFLEGKVADIAKALDTTGKEWLLNLPGNDANYEITWDGTASKYDYTMKTTGLTPWQAADIKISGAVTEGFPVEDDTTAPQLSLTWKFETPANPDTTSYDAGAKFSEVSDAATPSIATTEYPMTAGQDIAIAVNLGSGDKAAQGVASVKWNGTELLGTSYATYSNGTITIPGAAVTNLVKQSGNQTLVVTFDDEDGTEVNVTLTH